MCPYVCYLGYLERMDLRICKTFGFSVGLIIPPKLEFIKREGLISIPHPLKNKVHKVLGSLKSLKIKKPS